jgi:hypothetical protein
MVKAKGRKPKKTSSVPIRKGTTTRSARQARSAKEEEEKEKEENDDEEEAKDERSQVSTLSSAGRSDSVQSSSSSLPLSTPSTSFVQNLDEDVFTPDRKAKGTLKIHVALTADERQINEAGAKRVMSLPCQIPYLEKMTYSNVLVRDEGPYGQWVTLNRHVDLIMAYMLHILAVEGLAANKVYTRAIKDLKRVGKFAAGVAVMQPQISVALAQCSTIMKSFNRVADNWKMKVKLRADHLCKNLFKTIHPDVFKEIEDIVTGGDVERSAIQRSEEECCPLLRNVRVFVYL